MADHPRRASADGGVFLLGEGRHAQIRACTGSAVCALGITDSPGAGQRPRRPAPRSRATRRCGSSCPAARTRAPSTRSADIGLAGSKVRVGGRTTDGYQVFLGADLDAARASARSSAGSAEDDLDAAVDAIVGTWEALRHPGETLGRTVAPLGLDAFAAQVAAALDDRWAPGAEPEPSTPDRR